MGCLNSNQNFKHWFGNIHLSGPCNRSCYFCIGQHMMAMDPYNNLKKWPLENIEGFVAACKEHGVSEINLTGTNTEPLLYQHINQLTLYLRDEIFGVRLGLRTNGVLWRDNLDTINLFDKASVTICSIDDEINTQMMGGPAPDIASIVRACPKVDFKVNIVLGPENRRGVDMIPTLGYLDRIGIRRVNLREPYGQPHVGNILYHAGYKIGSIYGMPVYKFGSMEIVYWDVHYVEVESVNLYATGRVSVTYPITKGCADDGEVWPQYHFPGGRVQEQWQGPSTLIR